MHPNVRAGGAWSFCQLFVGLQPISVSGKFAGGYHWLEHGCSCLVEAGTRVVAIP